MEAPPSWAVSSGNLGFLAQMPSLLHASQKLSPVARGMCPFRVFLVSASSMTINQNLGVRAMPSSMRVVPIHSPTGVRVSLVPTGSVPAVSL